MATEDDIAMFGDGPDDPPSAPRAPSKKSGASAEDLAMFGAPVKDPRFVDDSPAAETRPLKNTGPDLAGQMQATAAANPAESFPDQIRRIMTTPGLDYVDPKSTAGAAIHGAVKGATFGLSDELSGVAGLAGGRGYVAPRDAARAADRVADDAHPWVHGGAELAAGIATSLPFGVGEGAYGVAKAAGAMGAVQGAGSSEADLTKGDVGGFARDVAINAGANAVLAHGTSKLIRGAPERVDERILKNIARGEAGGAAKDKLADNMVTKAGEGGANLIDVLERNGLKKVTSTSSASAPGHVEKKITTVIDRISSERLDPVYKAIDAGPAVPKSVDLQYKLLETGEALRKSGRPDLAETVERYQNHIATNYKEDAPLTASMLRQMRKGVGEAAFKDLASSTTTAGVQAKREIYGVFNNVIETAAQATPGVDVAALRSANNEVSTLLAARDTLADRAVKDAKGRSSLWQNLTSSHLAAGALSGAVGGAHGGGTEGLATGLAAMGALKVAPPLARRADFGLSQLALAARGGSVPAQLGQAGAEFGVSRMAGDALARQAGPGPMTQDERDRELARRLQAQRAGVQQ